MKISKLPAIAALAMFSLLPASCDFLEDLTKDDDTENNDNGGNNNGVTNAKVYAQYTFDGNTNPTGQTNTVGVTNNTRFVESFNGTKAIEIAANGLLSFPEAMIDCKNFTVSFWTKDCFDGHLFHVEAAGSGNNTCFTLGVENGRLKFVQSDYNCNYQWENISPYANKTLEGWHHVAVTNADGASTLYVDGVKTDQHTETSIGCYDNGLKIVFGGALNRPFLPGDVRTLDNLRFYKAMLSADGIKKIYNSEAPKGFTPGTGANTNQVVNNALYGYFKMDGNADDATRTQLIPVLNGTSFVESYDGTKALKIPAGATLSVPEGLIDQKNTSICFWTKDLFDGHIFHVNQSGDEAAFTLAVVNGHLKFVRDGYNCNYRFEETNPFNNSTLEGWHHIALVTASDNKKLYIDGILSDQQTETGVALQKGIGFVMGGSLARPNLGATTITLDNLRVYKYRAITAEEVKAIYDFER